MKNAKEKYRIALKSLVTGPLAPNKCEGSRQTAKGKALCKEKEKRQCEATRNTRIEK
jgi:hypothetical protein